MLIEGELCSKCGALWTAQTLENGLCVWCVDRAKRSSEYHLSTFGLPAAYMDKSNYRNKDIMSRVTKFLDADNDKGMYLYGHCGVGKTHLAAIVYKQLATRDKKWLSAPELFLEIRETFDKGSDETEREVLDKYSNVEYLFLDDFAAEKISDFTRESIYLLLDRRIRFDKLKVFFTSNLSPKEVGKVLSDRVASRIMEICGENILKISGSDWRLPKGGDEQ